MLNECMRRIENAIGETVRELLYANDSFLDIESSHVRTKTEPEMQSQYSSMVQVPTHGNPANVQ
jgi:hypothetical protein